MINLAELIGKRFGTRRVVFAYRDQRSCVRVHMLCDCGELRKGLLYSNIKSTKFKSGRSGCVSCASPRLRLSNNQAK